MPNCGEEWLVKNNRGDRLLKLGTALLSFCLTFAALYALYWKKDLVPFGPKTLMIYDANWQYLDFSSYLKDVFAGKNSLIYTFSKGIGGSGLALFAYYIASPLNYLVVFFEKSDIHAFFAMLYALKISLAAAFFSWFLTVRFFRERYALSHVTLTVLLSVSYALGQYSISQASNIMWLDGVYMLPLIMLGTWNVARGGRVWKLAVPVGLSILINWYSAGANCVFSALYFIFELSLALGENEKKRNWKYALKVLARYAVAMAIGVLLSACLFFPTILALSGTDKASLKLSDLLDFTLNGNPLNTIRKLAPGSRSAEGTVALCCGTLALLGCVSLFRLKCLPRWKRTVYVAWGIVVLAAFYFKPLVLVFSLLKRFDSYWYRYSYAGIASLVFLAAAFFYEDGIDAKTKASMVIRSMLLMLLAWMAAAYVQKEFLNTVNQGLRWYFLAGIALAAYLWCRDRGWALRLASAALCVALAVADIGFSAALLMDYYSDAYMEQYKAYSVANRAQIDAVQAADEGPYRMVQTHTRMMINQNTAMYNEPIGNGYWSNVIYASTVDQPQMQFLNRVGYPEWADTLNVANTCQLGVDSLLSVKYVLSRYPINGLVRTDLQEGADGKATYQNPYCLPFALRFTEVGGLYESDNPFEYQNAMYSKLIGEKTEIYVPLEFTTETSEDNKKAVTYALSIPEGAYAVYGNLPWEKTYEGHLDLNGRERCFYAVWFSPNVFYVPTEPGDTAAYVSISTDQPEKLSLGGEQFYGLDLKALERVTEALSARAAEHIAVKNGYAEFTATAESDGERLFVSIPYDAGWRITLNGKALAIDPEQDVFENCLYQLPLQAGENTIRMTYRVPHMRLFIAISILAALLLAALELWRTRMERQRRGRKRAS